jgi:16S rRNA processing protein RimM
VPQPPRRIATPSSKSSAEVLVGEVLRPHGLQGEVIVGLHSENPDRFSAGAEVRIGPTPDAATPATVVSSRPHQKGLLIQFEGVSDRDAAEAIRGNLIFIEQSQLSILTEGWWEGDLIGLQVLDREGKKLGTISAVSTGAHQDVWEVETGESNVQVPAVAEIVVDVDLKKGIVVIDPPAGLFE